MLVISFGCLIHGTSVVYGIYAIMGLARDSSTLIIQDDDDLHQNQSMKNISQTELGFEFDSVRDSSWIISIGSLGMIMGSVLAAPLSDRRGILR